MNNKNQDTKKYTYTYDEKVRGDYKERFSNALKSVNQEKNINEKSEKEEKELENINGVSKIKGSKGTSIKIDEKTGEKIIENDSFVVTVDDKENIELVKENNREKVFRNSVESVADFTPTQPSKVEQETENKSMTKVKDVYKDYKLINDTEKGFSVVKDDKVYHVFNGNENIFAIGDWSDESFEMASKSLLKLGVPISKKELEKSIKKLREGKENLTTNNVIFYYDVNKYWIEW
ncbi:hypothetical protein [Virgibacillus sp. DJP39]|uniref:hypothetical protein n=1 Tax=Virgibacillus sp. DJP39 TaxID=3409790 RepID=UPI003BB4D173